MMSSTVGEYFVDWKILGGSEDWCGTWRKMVDGEEWLDLDCPPLMLPRQLNGHFIYVGLYRRGEDLVVKTRYHRSTSSTTASMLLNCFVCLTIPVIGGNSNMTLEQQGQTQLEHHPTSTVLVVFPSPPWNEFDRGTRFLKRAAPPSIMLRVLPTL